MLVKLEELGVLPSFSRPRVSDDNPFPEAAVPHAEVPARAIPTSRSRSSRMRACWVAGFVGWYNDDHQHSGIRFVTPSQRHGGHDVAILAHRPRSTAPLAAVTRTAGAATRGTGPRFPPCDSTRNTESTASTHAATMLTLTGTSNVPARNRCL